MHEPVEIGRVVVAAGSGIRYGGTLNKPFLLLGGRPVIIHTLEALARAVPPGPMVVVHRPVDAPRLESLRPELRKLGCDRLVPGGDRRRDSVLAGIRALPPSAALALIHDAVRPFPPPEGVRAVIDAARVHGAAILALPARDTLKRIDGRQVTGTLDREGIVHSQTPQVFDRDRLQRLLESDPDETMTDEAMLYEKHGGTVVWVPGEARNLKITTPDDLRLAEAILAHADPVVEE